MSDEQRTPPETSRPADVPARPRAARADTDDTRYGLDQWLQQADDLGAHPWDIEAVMRAAGTDAVGRAELVRLLKEHGARAVGPDATMEG